MGPVSGSAGKPLPTRSSKKFHSGSFREVERPSAATREYPEYR